MQTFCAVPKRLGRASLTVSHRGLHKGGLWYGVIEPCKILLARYFERVIAVGRLKTTDPWEMATHFQDLCRGELHDLKLWNVRPNPDQAEIKRYVAEVVCIFLAAYGVQRC